jgi:4-amino-4-deoxy-L-arabinose transferase-like glycosyltransferase
MRDINLTTREYLLIILIAVLGLFPRLWRVTADLQIHFDQGLHSLAIWNIWANGDLSLLGHQTDTDGIFHGPIYYWFMTPSYMISGGDPAGASIFQSLLNMAAIVFLASLAKSLFDSRTALISSILYSVSYGYASYSRWLSNVTPTLPFSIIFFWLLYKIYCGKSKFLPWAGLTASLVTQFDGAVGFFLYPLLVWVILSQKIKTSWKVWFYFTLATFLPHLPSLIFELRHGFVITNSVLKLSSSSSHGIGISLSVLKSNFIILIKELFHLTTYPYHSLIYVLLILAGIFFFKETKKQRNFLFFSISLPFLSLSLYQRGAVSFFFMPLFPLFTIIFARTLLRLPKLLAWVVICFLILINIYQWKNFVIPTHALTPIGTFNLITNKDRKMIVDWIYKDANGKPFAIWIYTIPYFLDDPWIYYFEWYGFNKYGYKPEKSSGFSPQDLKEAQIFYNIYEPDDNQPTKLSSWLHEAEKNFGLVKRSFISNDARVERRVWERISSQQ